MNSSFRKKKHYRNGLINTILKNRKTGIFHLKLNFKGPYIENGALYQKTKSVSTFRLQI